MTSSFVEMRTAQNKNATELERNRLAPSSETFHEALESRGHVIIKSSHATAKTLIGTRLTRSEPFHALQPEVGDFPLKPVAVNITGALKLVLRESTSLDSSWPRVCLFGGMQWLMQRPMGTPIDW